MTYKVVDGRGRGRVASVVEPESGSTGGGDVRLTLPARDFLFTQASIVCSVMLETNSHLIKPETALFVNANGDGWSNEALKANYLTFIGAFNFVNHVQIPDRSVGFIADAALRRIWLDMEQQIYVHYVDILVATSRKHKELCDLILTNKIKWLSMGCDMTVSTCSVCGNEAADEMGLCDHLAMSKGKSFIDKQGLKRITCELLGNANPGTCTFIEASYLTEPPASGSAIKRSVLPISEDQSVVVRMPEWAARREAVQMWAGSYADAARG